MECQKDCTSMTKKHFRLQSLFFFLFFFFLRMLLKGFLIKQPTAPKKNRMDFLMKSGTGFPHVTPPRQAVFLLFLFLLKQMHSEVLVERAQWLRPPHFAYGQETTSAFSCHNRPKKQNGDSPVFNTYKLIPHVTEEKTAKVKPFRSSFFCYVCVYVSIPFPLQKKSAHMTDGFKICSASAF